MVPLEQVLGPILERPFRFDDGQRCQRFDQVAQEAGRENPHWGTERIRGEPLKLGIAVSTRSVRRYRRR